MAYANMLPHPRGPFCCRSSASSELVRPHGRSSTDFVLVSLRRRGAVRLVFGQIIHDVVPPRSTTNHNARIPISNQKHELKPLPCRTSDHQQKSIVEAVEVGLSWWRHYIFLSLSVMALACRPRLEIETLISLISTQAGHRTRGSCRRWPIAQPVGAGFKSRHAVLAR